MEDARAGRSRLPEKPVLLTFDDGYESFYRLVFPLLKAYQYPAVFAVVTGWLDTPSGGSIAYGNRQLPRSAFCELGANTRNAAEAAWWKSPRTPMICTAASSATRLARNLPR